MDTQENSTGTTSAGEQQAVLPTPGAFVVRLEEQWLRFNNTPSLALRQTWQQMGECLNRQVERSLRGERGRWQVLQGRTGTAKTLGLQVWSAMLPPAPVPASTFTTLDHPGVLIVTKLIDNARDIANAINTLAREFHGIDHDVALDYHSKNRTVAAQDLHEWPVLVVTHAAFQIAMGEQIHWRQYQAFAGGTRRCVVIDESLELIKDVQVDVNAMRYALGSIPFGIARLYSREMKMLTWLKDEAEFFASSNTPQDAVLVQRRSTSEPCDLTELRKALTAHRQRSSAEKVEVDVVDQTLDRMEIIATQWAWFSSQVHKTLNTSSFLIPETILEEGAVVLDATASTNAVYTMLGKEKVEVLPRPSEPRTYRKANLWVSFGHRVGKGTMGRIAKDEAHVLVDNLRRQFSAERKVFVGLSMVSEDAFDVYRSGVSKDKSSPDGSGTSYGDGSGFARFDVAHYGETDGRNDYNMNDVAVIFGLNYPSQERAVNLFNALKGVQDARWFREDVEKVRRSFTISHLVTSCIQMFNRTIVRKCVSEQGDCPPADLLILLPPMDGNEHEATLARALQHGLLAEMPGLVRQQWDYRRLGGSNTGKRHMVKRSKSEGRFLAFCESLTPGQRIAITFKVRAEQIKVSAATWERWVIRFADAADPLTRAMVARGVSFEASLGAPRPSNLVKKGSTT